MSAVVPPGVSAHTLSEAIAALADALGAGAVVTDHDELLGFRDPYTYRESGEFDASAMVMPASTEQVQAVVRIANRYRLPLWAFGQGRNNTYGGPAPRLRGSVIVNLRAMDRVLEVNERLAYAVVQPGVRWFDLFGELEARGGTLWTSIPDLGWGSVVGNSLENGIGYTPQGDHASNICGLEVVLPDGELLRTGMGAMEGNAAWHVYPHAFGPQLRGLFQQSNYGIVTAMGWKLMPRPEAYACCWVRCRGFGPLAEVVDALQGLLLDATITNFPMATRGMEFDDEGNSYLDPASDLWSIRFALYGRRSLVDARFAVCADVFARIAGAELIRKDFSGTDIDGPATHDERVQRGIPDMDLLDPARLPFGADTAHLDFSPVSTCGGDAVVRTEQLMRSFYERRGVPYVGGIHFGPRAVLHFSTVFFDPRDEAQAKAAFEGYTALVHEMAAHGYVPYRTNLQHMDLVAGQFAFGGHIQRRVAEAIKEALDPNGILSAGKSGIWPASLRQA